jgi:hypothetical protein
MKRQLLILVPSIPMFTIGSGITLRVDDLVVRPRFGL